MAAKKNTAKKNANRRRPKAKPAPKKEQETPEEPLSPEDLVSQDPKAAQDRYAKLGKQILDLKSKQFTASATESVEISKQLAALESECTALERARERAAQAEVQELYDAFTSKVEEAIKKGKIPLPPPGYGSVRIMADEEGEALLVQRDTRGGSRPKLTATRTTGGHGIGNTANRQAPDGMTQGQWYYERLQAGERKSEIAHDLEIAATSVHSNAKRYAIKEGLPVL